MDSVQYEYRTYITHYTRMVPLLNQRQLKLVTDCWAVRYGQKNEKQSHSGVKNWQKMDL